MNLGEFRKLTENLSDDKELVVVVDAFSIGPTPHVQVDSVRFGIDWDSGRVLLRTKEKIIKGQREKKQ